MSIKEKWLNIPVIQIKNVYNEDLKTIYYELWLNGQIEGRYPLLESVLWRLSLLISEEALLIDFNEVSGS